MRAITISRPGGPEVLTLADLPDPVPAAGEVLIRVRAFGINHADAYMRSGAWGQVADVPGIEAAGTVAADPSGTLAAGAPVVAILGGMGRSRNGSYAELVTVPATNVVPVTGIAADLPWTTLAAIPEVYATAWSALHANLELRPGQTILVRGATSALGQAVVDLARDLGATVVATSRSAERAAALKELGADTVLVDDGALAARVAGHGLRIDAVADLVGNSVLRDSLACLAPRGQLCQLGFLGGLAPVADFNPLTDLPTGVQLSFFGSAFVLGTPEYPLAGIPLNDIFAKVAAGTLRVRPPRTFAVDDIVAVHRRMEAGTAGGKMVVEL
ncbi:NADPH2:quinone reductase [Catenulispora sp. EB89]|uniref:zinc-binding dehydrogenase n=1 Tax=Catenulispora sp. EB89 TaxID=3156257 RepID=UPI003513B5F1